MVSIWIRKHAAHIIIQYKISWRFCLTAANNFMRVLSAIIHLKLMRLLSGKQINTKQKLSYAVIVVPF